MRNKLVFTLIIIILVMTGCSSPSSSTTQIKRVGLLIEDTRDDQGWNSKGYQGLLQIQKELNVEVVFLEEVNDLQLTKLAIEEFKKKDVNLIFGHGRIFADYFTTLGSDYPDIHFVSFNGAVDGDNVTSLHFESHAMGFFGGMVAAEMTSTNQVGVIAAYEWQTEVKGFIEGAKHQKPTIDVNVQYVNSWSDVDKALEIYHDMSDSGVEVFYPTGDGYHVSVLEEVKKDGNYVIGFINDQSDLAGSTVLTSTIQHVDSLYQLVAERFNRGELQSGNLYYDFADGVISLGEYSQHVPEEVQEKINKEIQNYIATGKLPNENVELEPVQKK
ncbi:BMP family ABC transporter substrate-binding protein [Bacillus alkalicellulosilyticus]|uniref:BMP family ABC transporter substrate-binding protein n=1 Tax=Alkalihalobacterium alkalicellulosilyticum TaxID=1912214 RepID=UPI0009972868|nr:BMP family ABC transporter substrate-binding protein [Bacillus alkalicellulosilyticus]